MESKRELERQLSAYGLGRCSVEGMLTDGTMPKKESTVDVYLKGVLRYLWDLRKSLSPEYDRQRMDHLGKLVTQAMMDYFELE